MKNELNTRFQQKFTTGSYGVGIGRAWCSQKACEICSSLIQKKKLKKINFSSHMLPKQQSTSFWSQGILGVNIESQINVLHIKSPFRCTAEVRCFYVLRPLLHFDRSTAM
jgi:hypothetical protein